MLSTRVIKYFKNVVKDIVQEESMNCKEEISVYPMTIVQYYFSDIFKQELVLINNENNKIINIDVLNAPFKHKAFFRIEQKDIVIFIKNPKKFDFEILFANFLVSLYHELKHFFQHEERENIKTFSYEMIIFDMEQVIQCFDQSFYLSHHNKFYAEIDAGLYGVTKTISYLEQNGITLRQKNLLNKRKKIYQKAFEEYDIRPFLIKLNNIIQGNETIEINRLPGWLGLFYNQDKTFKSVDEILESPFINLIDNKFIEQFLSSEFFIDSINFLNLSTSSQNKILKILQESYKLEQAKFEKYKSDYKNGLITTERMRILQENYQKNNSYYLNKFDLFSNKVSQTESRNNNFK